MKGRGGLGKLRVWHPWLFVLFPVVSLYARNVTQIPPAEALRAALVGLAAAGLLFGLFYLAARDADRAGAAVTAAALLFFSFGHAYLALAGRWPGALFSRADVLTALWAAALILLPWLALRVLPRPAARGLTNALNAAGCAALALACGNIALFAAQNARAASAAAAPAAAAPGRFDDSPPEGAAAGPDIYYIILDSYGRDDLLAEMYGIEQNGFTDFLRGQGFTVAGQSRSNYGFTALSLASSLNYGYIDELLPVTSETTDRSSAVESIQHSAAVNYLKKLGYRVVAFETGYSFTELRDADVFFKNSGSLNSFETQLLSASLANIWLDRAAPQKHRDDLRETLANLASAPRIPGPKLVFAHILLPHAPFVFDRNGGPVEPSGSGDGSYFYGTTEEYLHAYREQLLYTNTQMEKVVRAILEQSAQPPVIVIQGDHGPGARFHFNDLARTCLRERYGILNAYYLPGGSPPGQDITPVNTFRLIFNTYFGDDLPLLPARSYFSTWERPFDLTEITAQAGGCAPLEGTE